MANAPTPEALNRLAAYVERRIAELGLQYAEVARAAGFSDQTLISVRNGTKVRSTTYRKLERALYWSPESVQTILDGGEPTPLDMDLASADIAEAYADQRAAAAATAAARKDATLPLSSRELEVLAGMVASAADGFDMSPDDLEVAFRRAQEIIQQRRQGKDGRNEGPEEPSRHRAS